MYHVAFLDTMSHFFPFISLIAVDKANPSPGGFFVFGCFSAGAATSSELKQIRKCLLRVYLGPPKRAIPKYSGANFNGVSLTCYSPKFYRFSFLKSFPIFWVVRKPGLQSLGACVPVCMCTCAHVRVFSMAIPPAREVLGQQSFLDGWMVGSK